jgi:hypothetical protein
MTRTPFTCRRSCRIGAVLLAVAMAWPAAAGTGPEADPPALPPSTGRESRPLGPSRTADATAAPDAAAPTSGGSGWFLRTALSLGAVVSLIAGSAAVARTVARGRGGLAGAMGAGGRAPSGVLSVLGRYPVCRGQKLVLLQLDRRVLLVAQSAGGRLGAGGGMSTLCEITDPEEVASLLVKARDAESDSMSERFRAMLGTFERALRPHADEPPDHQMRKVFAATSGDRVELWDEGAVEEPAPFPMKQPGPPERDAVGSLRRRLAALRSETGEPEGAA